MQKNILPVATVKTLYASIQEPHFHYCWSVWSCCGATTINQLQKLQNRATRSVVVSSFNSLSGPLIKSRGWKTIRELVDDEAKLIVYKSINGLFPEYLCNLLATNSFNNSYSLQNTATDLKISKKASKNG